MSSVNVTFNLKTAGFAVYANQTLTFKLLQVSADKSPASVILPGIVTATSAANGTGSVALFVNGLSDIASTFEVIFPNRERGLFKIPLSAVTPGTITLAELLVDHVPGGSEAPQNSVYDAAVAFARQRANHTGVQLLNTISDGTEGVQDIVGGMVTGNTETGITVTYEDSDGTLDFVVASQTDQNFTTALKNKLDSIAGSTTEEIQDIAGALVATGGTKTGIAVTYDDANNNMDFVVASQTDENFTTADHDKLDGISPSADVTDATTVAGAGALMDSEVDADIKTLSLPASTTINDFARTSLLNSDATLIKSALGVSDASAIAGFVPNSITFPAASDFLSIANDTDLNVGTGDFTLSFWARLDSSETQPVIDKYSGTGYSLKFSSGSLVLTMQDTVGPLTATFGTALNDNKWHVYVVSVDRSGNAVAYIDNVAQTALPVTAVDATLDNTTVFRIGFDGSNAGSGIALGNYVVLHKEALDATEAAQIYFSADTALTVGSPLPSLMVDLRDVTETFTDVSAGPLAIVTNGSIRFNQDRLTEFTGTNVLATSTLGYATGSGGSATAQSGNKSATITLDKINGKMTMHNESMSANDIKTFQFTNSTIAATDVVIVNIASEGTPGNYLIGVSSVSSGNCEITLKCIAGTNITDALVLNFAVIKAVQS